MKLWLKILIAVIFIGIVSAVLVYKFVYNKPHPNYEKEKAVYTVTAQNLYDEFKQDSAQASKKYIGQVIEVDGAVTKIEEVDSLVIAVFVFEQGMFGDQGVRVTMLPDFNNKIKQTLPGATVKLKGLCNGHADDVIIEKGSIVE